MDAMIGRPIDKQHRPTESYRDRKKNFVFLYSLNGPRPCAMYVFSSIKFRCCCCGVETDNFSLFIHEHNSIPWLSSASFILFSLSLSQMHLYFPIYTHNGAGPISSSYISKQYATAYIPNDEKKMGGIFLVENALNFNQLFC